MHARAYLPEPVYEALRKIAFHERVKIHDLVLEGIDAALRRRGYPSVESLKAGRGGRVIKQAWTARSQKRRPAPLPACRPEPPGGRKWMVWKRR